MTLLTNLRKAWDALCGRVTLTRFIETDAQAELVRAMDRVLHAFELLKDCIPMALIDDFNALVVAENNALAAKDAAAAQTVQDLATANATIATLQAQINDTDAAIVARTGVLTPAPADPNAPVI